MTREWRTWQADQAEALYAVEKDFRIRSKVKLALEQARLYGGSALLIGDGSADPSKPLDPERFPKGGLKYIHNFTRHDLKPSPLVTDVNSPWFRLSEFYSINQAKARARLSQIHRTRFVFFTGPEAPGTIKGQVDNWGLACH
jgi:hypothetical protein